MPKTRKVVIKGKGFPLWDILEGEELGSVGDVQEALALHFDVVSMSFYRTRRVAQYTLDTPLVKIRRIILEVEDV